MPTIEELLADSQLTDDIKISLPGGKEVTVKDLRTFAATQKAASDTAIREAMARKKVAEEEIAKAQHLGADSLALWEEASKLKAEGRTEVKPGDIDWENDPVYRPIDARLKKLEAERLAVFADELEKMKKALGAGFRFVTDDYQERRWNALPKDARPKDKTWRDFVEAAQKGNIKDQYGLDDPIEAFNRSTAAERDAARLEAARKAGIEEGKKQAGVASLPRPGSTPQVPKPGDSPRFKDLRDAMAAAAQDPEILRIANGDENIA